MAIPTSNYGSTYYNTNQCYSFNGGVATLAPLSSQPCSEVIIYNTSGAALKIYDGSQYNDPPGSGDGRADPHQGLEIPFAAAENPLQPVTIRGLTNADQVSAVGGANIISWRTQFFSSNPRTA